MKKTVIFIFSCFALFPVDGRAQANDNIELLFSFKNLIEPNQYELGLSLVDIQIANTGKQSFQTSPLFWEIFDEGALRWQRFWADNIQQKDLSFGPYGVQTLSVHLNISALDIKWYQTHTASKQGGYMVRAGVLCCENGQVYHTEAIHIKVFPLNATDKAALTFLQQSGISSHRQLHPSYLPQTAIRPALLDSLIQLHPRSTFTTLASLAQAHHYRKQAETREKALALLVRPLLSRFTYIRYLSEELAKLCL